jgi:hypothetical protein
MVGPLNLLRVLEGLAQAVVSEHPVSADEITALSDTFARKTHRFAVVAADELGVGGDPIIDRRKRVART